MKRTQQSPLNHQYRNIGNDITPFEVYLKYTNEKEVSTKQLAKILSSFKADSLTILDVGSGDGQYLLSSLPKDKNFKITFLEPSIPLFESLQENIRQKDNLIAINKTFEQYYKKNREKFDIVLASHLYHFTKDKYSVFISQLISLLNDSGSLIWIERGIDDITDFKKRFKRVSFTKSNSKEGKPRSYTKALELLTGRTGEVKLILNKSELRIPYKNNIKDTRSIIDFYLNKEWDSIPLSVQKKILDYIASKNGVFKQEEGIVIYTLP